MRGKKDTEDRIFTIPQNIVDDLRAILIERMEKATVPTDEVMEVFDLVIGGFRIVMEDRPVEHALRSVMLVLVKVLDAMDDLQSAADTQELLRGKERDDAERVLAATRDQLDRQTAAAETARQLLASQGGMASATERWIRSTMERLDALLMEAQEIESSVLRVSDDARTHIPDLIAGTLDYEKRCTELSARAAPLLARAFNLTFADLAELEKTLRSQERLDKECGQAGALAEETQRELAEVKARVDVWQKRWSSMREDFKAADALLPKIFGSDPYLLCGMPKEEVESKRRLCGERATGLHCAVAECQQAVHACMHHVQRSGSRVAERTKDLEALRDRLTLPGYEEMSESDRMLTRSAVLCFNDEKEGLSFAKLAGTVAIVCMDNAGAQERMAELVATSSLLAPRGQARFRIFALTERGMYWHARWRAEDPERVGALATARTKYDEDVHIREKAARAERERKTGERKKKADALQEEREHETSRREAERNDPFRIRDRMDSGALALFCLLGQWPSLPATRDAMTWAKLLAAAEASDLLSVGAPAKTAKNLVRLIEFRPALLAATRNDRNVLVTVCTTVGEGVCRIMAAPADERLYRWHELFLRWDASDKLAELKTRRQALFEALHQAMLVLTDI